MVDAFSPPEAFAEAVRIAGGQSPFARLVDVTQGAVWQRLNKGQPAAPEWVLRAEQATGVSRHDLRPDLYPRPGIDDARTPPAATPDRRTSPPASEALS